jgi:hypothetical protein
MCIFIEQTVTAYFEMIHWHVRYMIVKKTFAQHDIYAKLRVTRVSPLTSSCRWQHFTFGHRHFRLGSYTQ